MTWQLCFLFLSTKQKNDNIILYATVVSKCVSDFPLKHVYSIPLFIFIQLLYLKSVWLYINKPLFNIVQR